LDAAQRYRGTIVDLDASCVLGPDEFAKAREALTRWLAANGLSAGDRVVVAIANGPLFIATLVAILACEASPLVVHSKTPPAELLRYARRFGAHFLAGEPEDEPGRAEIETTTTRTLFADVLPLDWSTLCVGDQTPVGPELRGVPLHPTSGSTGLPKIALRPGHAALEEARHYAETMSINADDAILAIPPMSHAYGYGTCVMVPLLTGASIVSMRRFSPKAVQRAMLAHRLTILPMVPAMLDVLSFGGRVDMRRLRWVLAAGAVLPRRSAEQFQRQTGAVASPLYGTTETGGISVATSADGLNVDGRVGPPMEGIEVCVRPTDEPGHDGELGRLLVRSSSQMNAYLDERGALSHSLADGWFDTGDLAQIADDGVIHLRGRGSDVINVSGLKVVPCEVEETIASLPGVLEVKVYAGQHRSGSQLVKAAVATERGVSVSDIRAHCEQQLVYYKRPQVVNLVEALPRNPAGKIIRDQLP
jgi:acyl-coenzyme A synthetase/AMP-(fatty) acid ligase